MGLEVPADTEALTDDGPFIAKLVMQFEQFFFLGQGPLLTIEGRVKVVVVSEVMKCAPFATLLASPSREAELRVHLLGNEAPLVDPHALVELLESAVFLLSPGALPASLPAHTNAQRLYAKFEMMRKRRTNSQSRL